MNKNDGVLLLRSYDNGGSWDSLFSTNNHTNEYIADIIKTENDIIYLALGTYLPDMGGVYRSLDNGQTWQFLGLLNHSVSALAFNSNNDLFAAVRGAEYNFYPGVYILRNGSNSWESHIEGTMVEDLIINSTDHIYISSSWPEGIGRSIDNGANFEMINRGLGGGGMGKMIFDQEEFIYTTTSFSTSSIYKSTKTSVNIFEDPERYNNNNVVIYPNPFINDLNIKLLDTPSHFSRLQIFNNFGIEVYHKDLSLISSQIDINTENLLPGLYLLHLKSENAIRVFKLIKY